MPKRSTYHKEHLRQDLVEAGRDYVEKHGHSSLSVRTLAQKVGVSSGAPYHHFADRRILLLAIASEGFKSLTGEAELIGASDIDGREKLIALGMHFIDFADRSPRMFELMYESEISTPEHWQELEHFHHIGHRLIRNAITSELKRTSPKNIEIRAVAFWAFVYGFAALRRTYKIQSFDLFKMSREEVALSVVSRAAAAASVR